MVKNKMLQKRRVKDMAEVYTSSWICNAQINSIDSAWFGKENIFNRQIISNNGTITWKTNKNKIRN